MKMTGSRCTAARLSASCVGPVFTVPSPIHVSATRRSPRSTNDSATPAMTGDLAQGFEYFPGAMGNVSVNCVDRHARATPDKVAVHWFGEDGTERSWTYAQFLDETARFAHVFLPGTSFLEKDGTFTNAERRINRVRPVMPPRVGKHEWEVACEIAQAMGYEMHYDDASQIMDEIARLTPTFAGVSFEKLDDLGSIQWPCNDKAPEGTPVMHVNQFVRGKGAFVLTEYVPTDEKIGPRGAKVRCSKCQNVFLVHRDLGSVALGAAVAVALWTAARRPGRLRWLLPVALGLVRRRLALGWVGSLRTACWACRPSRRCTRRAS